MGSYKTYIYQIEFYLLLNHSDNWVCLQSSMFLTKHKILTENILQIVQLHNLMWN